MIHRNVGVKMGNKEVMGPEKTLERNRRYFLSVLVSETVWSRNVSLRPSRGDLTGLGEHKVRGLIGPHSWGGASPPSFRPRGTRKMPSDLCPEGPISETHLPPVLIESTLTRCPRPPRRLASVRAVTT